MRIVVSGGAGFLGAALLARARAAGHAALSLDRDPAAELSCDIADAPALAAALAAAAPEAVVHLASILTDAAAADPAAATRANALGTAAFFQGAIAAGARRIVYASSVAAVGSCPEGSGDAVALTPGSVYGATKAFGEHLARALSAAPGAPGFIILRLGSIYGPGRRRGWRAGQAVIEQFAAGLSPLGWPDFSEPIDWTWIEDAAEMLLRAATLPLPPFLALNALGERRRMAEAVAHLQRRFPAIAAYPIPAALPPSAWGLRNEGLAAALGNPPATRMEDGIDRLLASLAGPRSPPSP